MPVVTDKILFNPVFFFSRCEGVQPGTPSPAMKINELIKPHDTTSKTFS